MTDQLERLQRLTALMERAKQFHESGQLSQEAEQLQEAIRLSPELWLARKQLALVHLENDDLYRLAQVLVAWLKEDGTSYLEDFASKHGVIASALTMQGLNTKIQTGDSERALGYFTLAVQLDPDDPEVLYNFGDSLHDCGRPKEAEKAFGRLVHLRPDYADAWNTLGIIKEDLDDHDGATDCYQKAVDLDPHLERAQNNLRRVKAKFWQSLTDGLYDDDD